MFSFSQTVCTLKPHSAQRIVIRFSPKRCGNYYERIFCVVRNHKVLYVDLMGASFDILTKPVPLMQRHIDVYRHKVIMGAHTRMSKTMKMNAADASYSMNNSMNDTTDFG